MSCPCVVPEFIDNDQFRSHTRSQRLIVKVRFCRAPECRNDIAGVDGSGATVRTGFDCGFLRRHRTPTPNGISIFPSTHCPTPPHHPAKEWHVLATTICCRPDRNICRSKHSQMPVSSASSRGNRARTIQHLTRRILSMASLRQRTFRERQRTSKLVRGKPLMNDGSSTRQLHKFLFEHAFAT